MTKPISPARMREHDVTLRALYIQFLCEGVSDAEATERADLIASINEVRFARNIQVMSGKMPLLMSAPTLRQMLRAEVEAGLPVAA